MREGLGFMTGLGRWGCKWSVWQRSSIHSKQPRGGTVCHPQVKNGDVAVLVKKAPSISIESQGAAKNAAFVDIVHNNRFIRVISVYCPCRTEGPITELRDMVQAIPDTVVVGDWNAASMTLAASKGCSWVLAMSACLTR